MIKGNIIRLNTLHLNSASMNGVREVQGSSASGGGGIVPIPPVVPPSKEYIQFEDPVVEAICVANWSSDGIGLTMEDAAKVTSLGQKFKGNKTIEKFEELRYFTGLTSFTPAEFRNCTSLKVIAFPPQMTTTSLNQFSGCTSLEEVKTETPVKVLETGTFYGCSAFARIDTSELEEMRNTNTGSGVFYGCAFTEFNAPKLKTIGTASYTAHFQNSKLEKVISMGEVSEFPDCNTNYGIFKGSNLAEIEIPATTTKLGNYLFYNCSKLSKVICRASTPPSLGSNALQGTNSALIIYVPDASLEAYKTATNWNTYADRIHPLSEIEDYYVSDALLMHLDGINKGNVEGEWQDLVSGNTFVNHGAIAEADGWRFDGASSYMNSTNIASYGPEYNNRTFEIVAEFDRENTTEVVYMGGYTGYAFGRYAGGKSILLGSSVGLPSLADDMTSGVRIVSVSTTTTLQIVASKINGNNAQVGANNHFDGSENFIYLGKRASGSHFKGKIHAIRIHDRVLSEEEILYNQRIDNKRFNLGLDI